MIFMTNVLYAVCALGALGAVFGIILAFASRVFAVETDARRSAIAEILPGANCGGCGYAGCGAYAAAIVESGAPCNACVPGGSAAAAQIADIMGVSAEETERCVAQVNCSGTAGHTRKKLVYVGIDDCAAAMRLGGGSAANACPYGCLGYGSCVKACPFGAIHIVDGIAQVNHGECTGCMTCASACPKGIIIKVPYAADVTVACSSKDKGAVLRTYCDLGCLSCNICEKTCKFDAIHVIDGRAVIDYSKCVSCGQCAPKCPRKLIRDARLNTENETEAHAEASGQ
jgi:RnfABCDGE-type electron transport complex B subunit